MTFRIIRAVDTSPLPLWLTITLLVALFIAVTVIAAVISYRYRLNKLRKEKASDEIDNAE